MSIIAVGRAKDPLLTTQLIEYLLGQRDNEPKVLVVDEFDLGCQG